MELNDIIQKCATRKAMRQRAIRKALFEMWQGVDLDKIYAVVSLDKIYRFSAGGTEQQSEKP